jgi:peptide/nickel transport system ATP-binding protein
MIAVRDLTAGVAGQAGFAPLVDHLSFELQRGEIFALVGESGCGKSMTSLSLMRLLPGAVEIRAGEVNAADKDLLRISEKDMRSIRGRRISMIFQEPATSLNPVMTVGAQIVEAITLHAALPREKAREKALYWLKEVGIPEPEKRFGFYPHELSGGQKQRIMIAMALATEPDFLIADEPTTALDVTVQSQILELLKDLKTHLNLGILLITHDLAVVSEVADRVGLMYAGELVEVAGRAAFFAHPAHPYALGLLRASPDGKTKAEKLEAIEGSVPQQASRMPGCRFAPRCGFACAKCETCHPALEAIDETAFPHRVRCFFPRKKEEAAHQQPEALTRSKDKSGEAPVVLSVENLSVAFEDRTKGRFWKKHYEPTVHNVSFHVRKGTTTALIGESGSGKTTVAKAVLQLLSGALVTGSARLGECELVGLKGRALKDVRRRLQVVFQDPFGSLNPRMTVEEMLLEGVDSLHSDIPKKERIAHITRILRQCGMDESVLSRYPHEFSGGQRQRLAIARALSVEPEVIICDEPTSALDVSIQAQILNLLNEIQASHGVSYVFITHNFAVVRYMADDVVVMKEGRAVEAGSAEEVLTHPKTAYTQKLLASVPKIS